MFLQKYLRVEKNTKGIIIELNGDELQEEKQNRRSAKQEARTSIKNMMATEPEVRKKTLRIQSRKAPNEI